MLAIQHHFHVKNTNSVKVQKTWWGWIFDRKIIMKIWFSYNLSPGSKSIFHLCLLTCWALTISFLCQTYLKTAKTKKTP